MKFITIALLTILLFTTVKAETTEKESLVSSQNDSETKAVTIESSTPGNATPSVTTSKIDSANNGSYFRPVLDPTKQAPTPPTTPVAPKTQPLNTMMYYMDQYRYEMLTLSTNFDHAIILGNRAFRWLYADNFVLGEYYDAYLGDQWMGLNIGLEGTYMYDYGAQFAPYASAAAGIYMVSFEEEFVTDFVGHARLGTLFFFSKKKNVAISFEGVFGMKGGSDFRIGLLLRYNKGNGFSFF